MMIREVQLSAEVAEMPRLAAWVEAEAPGLGLSDRQTYAIQLCLEEVVANLVMHARPAAGAGIAVTVRIEDAPLRVTVEDDAEPFDLTALAPAAPASSLEAAEAGGLGLGLVTAYTTAREYRSEGGLNRLTLAFD
ncbi:ATP-binding protein [Roseococcus sp. SDR]|uniref:ATP-binding protein n=1 Tax=Roseococcus sp. SDR TaxID=2835532 RepID=UPI001BCF8AF9|nr:ATP-binding protein [Roseococcus sp. SDR]MBS7791276.1 ATP-binding protein [Roseococcus sp. SDR]MBV1846590.1 ATP-binding protein [Roseococcus sp. SDR]